MEPTDISADKGQVVTLTCAADGSPLPSYIWYRNSDINQVLYSVHHPRLVEPTDISADKGQMVMLTCAADGSPPSRPATSGRNSDINRVL